MTLLLFAALALACIRPGIGLFARFQERTRWAAAMAIHRMWCGVHLTRWQRRRRQRAAWREARRFLAASNARYSFARNAYAMASTKMHTDVTFGAGAQAAVVNAPLNQLDAALADIELQMGDFVVSGGLAGTSASLVISVPALRAFVINTYVTTATQNLTVAASKDTYVDVDTTGTLFQVAVANGAAAPAITANAIRLFKAVSGVAAVTSVADLRNLYPIAFGASLGVFNVLSYGADPTGAVDSTAAFAATIAAAQAAGGGIVWVPRGIYLITSTITVSGTIPVWIRGAGGGFFNSTTGTILQWTPVSAVTCINFAPSVIGGGASDFNINQNNATAGAHGLIVNGPHVVVRDVGVGNCKGIGYGVIATTVHVSECKASGVVAQNCGTGFKLAGLAASNLDCNGGDFEVMVLNSITNDIVLADRAIENRIHLRVVASHGTQPVIVGDNVVTIPGNQLSGWIEGIAGMTALTLQKAPGTHFVIRQNGCDALVSADAASTYFGWDAQNGRLTGPPAAGVLLAHTQYAPVGNTALNVTTTAPAALDTANLTVSFVAPASGTVKLVLSGRCSTSTVNDSVFWGVFTHLTTTLIGFLMPATDQASVNQMVTTQYITGLTPGTTYQWDWCAANGVGGVTSSLKCFGSTTVAAATQGGPAIMEVWAA